jgi:hypothetical protein
MRYRSEGMDNDYLDNEDQRNNPEKPGRIHIKKSLQKINLQKQIGRIFHKTQLSHSRGVVSPERQIPKRKKQPSRLAIKFSFLLESRIGLQSSDSILLSAL